MKIGICTIELHIPSVNSLKGKRMVLKSLLTNIKNRYNVSVAEIKHNDLWQRSTLAIVTVSKDSKRTSEVLSQVENFIKKNHRIQITDIDIETI
ncbi:DUF503 domain-containing protein [bacterium]|nr:DUF503 domain-containing protein [bacterium]